MIVNHREAVANRKITAPDNWRWFRLESVGDGVMLTGCTSSGNYTKGPRKGRPRYDGTPTDRVFVSDQECATEERRYEAETGKCATCGGDGKMWIGWKHGEGSQWAPCRACQTTGLASRQVSDKVTS